MSDPTDTPQAQEPTSTQQPDLNAVVEALTSIANSAGEPKYNDPVKAAEAAKVAQETYIPKLEEENKDLRTRLEALEASVQKQATTEDIVSQLSDKLSSQGTQAETPSVAALDEQKLADLVRQQIQKDSVEQKTKTNLTKFAEAVSKSTNDYNGAIERAANANGLSKEFVVSMAQQSPEAALKLMEIDAPAPTKTQSTVNTTTLTANNVAQSGKLKPLGLGSTHTDRMSRAAEYRKMAEDKLKSM